MCRHWRQLCLGPELLARFHVRLASGATCGEPLMPRLRALTAWLVLVGGPHVRRCAVRLEAQHSGDASRALHGRRAVVRTGAMAAAEAVACMLQSFGWPPAKCCVHKPCWPPANTTLAAAATCHPCVCSLGITLELTGLESDSSSRAEAQTLLGTCCAACFGEPLLPLAAHVHSLMLWPRRP